jgi:hypothetical protein
MAGVAVGTIRGITAGTIRGITAVGMDRGIMAGMDITTTILITTTVTPITIHTGEAPIIHRDLREAAMFPVLHRGTPPAVTQAFAVPVREMDIPSEVLPATEEMQELHLPAITEA